MANVFGPGRLEETGTWCVSSRLGYPMDLLEKLRAGDCRKEESSVTPAENEDNSVELNLSLGGCFSDKRKLERAASIAANPAVLDAIDSTFQVTRLNRWSSLPVKKTSSEFLELCSSAAETAGTRELDFFGRGDAKRQRSGDLNEVSQAFNGRRNVDGMNMERAVLPSRSMAACPPVRGRSRGGERGSHGGNLMFFGEGSSSIVGSSQGSGSSGGVSSGVSDLEKAPQVTAGATGLKRPANFSADTSQLRQKGIEASNMSMSTSNMKLLMGELPYVCTKGDGPNGRKIEGFLYKYDKGEEIRIVCVCHGSFLSPAEFVKHGGGGDVEHPLRHIVVNPFPPFLG